MKYIKAILAITMCALFYISGRYSVGEHECEEATYKKAFLDLATRLDSIHVHCYRIGN